jgi:hypothetical protein
MCRNHLSNRNPIYNYRKSVRNSPRIPSRSITTSNTDLPTTTTTSTRTDIKEETANNIQNSTLNASAPPFIMPPLLSPPTQTTTPLHLYDHLLNENQQRISSSQNYQNNWHYFPSSPLYGEQTLISFLRNQQQQQHHQQQQQQQQHQCSNNRNNTFFRTSTSTTRPPSILPHSIPYNLRFTRNSSCIPTTATTTTTTSVSSNQQQQNVPNVCLIGSTDPPNSINLIQRGQPFVIMQPANPFSNIQPPQQQPQDIQLSQDFAYEAIQNIHTILSGHNNQQQQTHVHQHHRPTSTLLHPHYHRLWLEQQDRHEQNRRHLLVRR